MADKFGVKNIGQRTYKEKYNDKEIVIEPGQTITMNRRDAIDFMGRRPAKMAVDGMGQLKAESQKPLQLIRHEPEEQTVYVSPRNGERYLTEESMLEEDAKYEKVEESANGHACPFCSETFAGPVEMATHLGTEHADDTSRHTKSSPVTV